MDETIDVPISVTQKHIDAGHKNDCGLCPIALAIREACPGADHVGVGTTGGVLYRTGVEGSCYFDLPLEAKVFVIDTDAGVLTEPLDFTISLPRDVAELPGFLADETLLAPLELEAMPL